MSFTQADLDAVNAAIGASELEVAFPDGSKVRYRSTADLMTAKSHIQKALNAAQGKRRVASYRMNVSKGV